MWRLIAGFCLFLALAPSGTLRAHTTDFIGGSLIRRPDGVVELRMDILARRLPVYAGELEGAWTTLADLRAGAAHVEATFLDSLIVPSAGREIAPARVEFPLLEQRRGDDAAALPEFIPLVVCWEGLPAVPSAVIPRFDLLETYVMLVLDDSLANTPTPHVTGTTPDASMAPAPTALPAGDDSSAPTPAGGGRGRLFGTALVIGYQHIVPMGLDHILFVLGLFLAARRMRDLVWQVTMFTVAHSITLGLAMAGVVVLSDTWSTIVEVAIAVSIVAVALENCVVKNAAGRRRLAIVGLFGLIHGLGFAGALSEINWPAEGFAVALLAANIGIELGQLTVVAIAAVAVAWAWKRRWYRAFIAVPASILIGGCGLFWAIQRVV